MNKKILIILKRIINFTNSFNLGLILTLVTLNLILVSSKSEYEFSIFLGLIIVIGLFSSFNILYLIYLNIKFWDNKKFVYQSIVILIGNITLIAIALLSQLLFKNMPIIHGILLAFTFLIGTIFLIFDVKNMLLFFKIVHTHAPQNKKNISENSHNLNDKEDSLN